MSSKSWVYSVGINILHVGNNLITDGYVANKQWYASLLD